MVWLPVDEKYSKICLFVLTWSTNVTDRRTNGHCMTAIAALMHSIAWQNWRIQCNYSWNVWVLRIQNVNTTENNSYVSMPMHTYLSNRSTVSKSHKLSIRYTMYNVVDTQTLAASYIYNEITCFQIERDEFLHTAVTYLYVLVIDNRIYMLHNLPWWREVVVIRFCVSRNPSLVALQFVIF